MRVPARRLAALVALQALALAPAATRAATHAIEDFELHGTIGPYRVGANMTIRDGNQLVAAHYFYATHLTDIPLQGQMQGAQMLLHEPGGGVFHLRLTGNDPAGKPLTFDSATQLQGEWTEGSKSLPVTLNIDSAYPGARSGRRYADVTDQSDAAFEAMVRRFIHGVLTNNRAEAADAVSYPLHVNGHAPLLIHDKAALLSHWDQIFTPKCIAWLRDTIPHEMFVRNGEAMVGNGLVWFDAHGAAAVNQP